MITMQTKQATTDVVAVVRAWSGTGAFAFTAPRAYTGLSVSIEKAPNHGTDAFLTTPRSGTTAWSPPV